MEKKTVKYHIPQHGIYMYARTNSGKTELIVLNSTDAEQVVANDHYRIMTNDSKSGKELISGKKIDLTKNMTVGARQSLIIELYIIRKTKCFDFWERNVLFPKTKRSFFRTPKHPLPCPFPLNFSLLIITKKFGNLAKNRYICIV